MWSAVRSRHMKHAGEGGDGELEARRPRCLEKNEAEVSEVV